MNGDSGDPTEIYVYLLDEGTHTWRPVLATQVGGSIYRILEQPYDRSDEIWEFEPGATVECEQRRLSGDFGLEAVCLVAVRRVD